MGENDYMGLSFATHICLYINATKYNLLFEKYFDKFPTQIVTSWHFIGVANRRPIKSFSLNHIMSTF